MKKSVIGDTRITTWSKQIMLFFCLFNTLFHLYIDTPIIIIYIHLVKYKKQIRKLIQAWTTKKKADTSMKSSLELLFYSG